MAPLHRNKFWTPFEYSRNQVGIVLNDSFHTLWQLGYINKHISSFAMDGSKARRISHKGIESHREPQISFPNPPNSIVLLQMNP